MKQSQTELIKNMNQRELRIQLIISQSIFIFIAFALSLFLFDKLRTWQELFWLDVQSILYLGILPALILVIIEVILHYILPKDIFDDGGINEKIFKNESIGWIFVICLLVSISEELLFRGVIQTTFGYFFASTLFAFIHFRYLKKILLFVFIIITSFLIGYLYVKTGNLLVTIAFHFVLDFSLGLFLRLKK